MDNVEYATCLSAVALSVYAPGSAGRSAVNLHESTSHGPHVV
ncbi:hypothetical protein ACFQYP_53700 [Nonomuraea antimicrobica]